MSRETFAPYIASLIIAENNKRMMFNAGVLPAIIAMACVEGNDGESILAKNYHNHFGMKCGSYWTGSSVNMQTHEEVAGGQNIVINDNFRTYANDAEGVAGFFDFVSTQRYENLQTATTSLEFLERIKADGYATSSTYVSTCMSVVNVLYGSGTTTNSVKSVDLKKGKNYTLLSNMAVRKNPNTGSPLVGYDRLSVDGKKNDKNKNGYLDAGTVITCKDYYIYPDQGWIKCPSGWVCAYDATNVYVR